jgi:hypothetical protein
MLRRRRPMVHDPRPPADVETDRADTIAEIKHLRIEQELLRRVGDPATEAGDRIDCLLEHLAALRAHS